MREYTLAYLLEDLAVGQEFGRWPLHITLVPWFTLNGSVEDFADYLRAEVSSYQHFSVTVGKQKQWRHHTVSIIQESGALFSLHKNLLKMAEAHGRIEAARFVGENFTPHITHKSYAKVQQGFRIRINRIYLIEAPKTNPLTRLKKVVGIGELR